MGLNHGINYKTDDVVTSVTRLTDNKGVNLVVDPVGGSPLLGSILSLVYRGRISTVGAAGHQPMTVDVSNLMGGNRSLCGAYLALQLSFLKISESMGNHDSNIVDACSVD